MKKLLYSFLAIITIASFLPTQASAQGEFEGEKVTIGLASSNAYDYWNVVVENALEQEGIEIELVLFSDYNQPNEALQNGSLDLNATQGYPFLFSWNDENNGTITPIGNTLITPLGLYSDKHTSVEDIPNGGTIAIPNDPSTYGRALQALEIAGLIDVDEAAGIFPEEKDILDNPKDLQFELLDPAMAAVVLQDVDAAIINTGFASDAGLKVSDAIFADAHNLDNVNPMYINVIAAREEDKDNPLYLKIVELFQTDEIAEIIKESSDGSLIPVFREYDVDIENQTVTEVAE
ncbi:MetQ/NlpA family ABC transporter substrate-binding protein [Ruoffia tabacinasalis]|uniref:MetQ/NlpA family ABC transporter substrate-binding protein n=1 Tax=Ruoffia tabacinasalis TaxID=87458 RepID=A0ABS0LKY3_9LACT|nr:MetQ/NlpA family ABC transporter substrate-binding protein [Ruoffia tabacinasalis]MBG9978104.1 MetQ/NlpA family ABC transporter substrate-binding protein [Ruoffia tabacinasalis]